MFEFDCWTVVWTSRDAFGKPISRLEQFETEAEARRFFATLPEESGPSLLYGDDTIA